MTFSSDIGKFRQKVEKVSTDIFRGTVLDIFSRVVKRTPVGNPSTWDNPGLWRSLGFVGEGYVGGQLRGNWQIQINTKPKGEIDNKDKSGAKAIRLGSGTINKAKLGDTIFLINNLPYAGVIEDGRSKQAPAGMVKVTVTEFENIVNANARKNKR